MFTMKIWHEKISHLDEFYILSIQLSLSISISLSFILSFSLSNTTIDRIIFARQVLTDCVKIGYKLILKNEIQIILRWYLSFI